jgi:hypothetical protein
MRVLELYWSRALSLVCEVALIWALRCGPTVSTLHTQTWIHIRICVLPTKQHANLWDMRVLSYSLGLVCRACRQMPCFPSVAMNWALTIYSSTELIAHFFMNKSLTQWTRQRFNKIRVTASTHRLEPANRGRQPHPRVSTRQPFVEDHLQCSRLKSSVPFKWGFGPSKYTSLRTPFKTQPRIENEDIT